MGLFDKIPKIVRAIPMDIGATVVFPHSPYELLLIGASEEKIEEIKRHPYLIIAPTVQNMLFDIGILGSVSDINQHEEGYTFRFTGKTRVTYARVREEEKTFYAQWTERPTTKIPEIFRNNPAFGEKLSELQQCFKKFMSAVQQGLTEDTKYFVEQTWVKKTVHRAKSLNAENLCRTLDEILGVMCRVGIGNRGTQIDSSTAFFVILNEQSLGERLEYTIRLLKHLTGEILPKPTEEVTQSDTEFLKSVGLYFKDP